MIGKCTFRDQNECLSWVGSSMKNTINSTRKTNKKKAESCNQVSIFLKIKKGFMVKPYSYTKNPPIQ